MKDELDSLLSEFARGQLEGNVGKTAAGFEAKIRRARLRRWGWVAAGLAAAAAFGIVVGLWMTGGGGGTGPSANQIASREGPELLTEDVWYQDTDGGMVVLDNNQPVRLVYRQVWQRSERVDEEHQTVLTDIRPEEYVMVVDQPVY